MTLIICQSFGTGKSAQIWLNKFLITVYITNGASEYYNKSTFVSDLKLECTIEILCTGGYKQPQFLTTIFRCFLRMTLLLSS